MRRIYHEEKLQVRRRGGRKRALGTRNPMVLPPPRALLRNTLPGNGWPEPTQELGFRIRCAAPLSSTLCIDCRARDGRRFRSLAVVDDFSRENLVLVADTSLFGTLRDARKTPEEWQEDYNWRRPHSALGNLTPMEFLQRRIMDKMVA